MRLFSAPIWIGDFNIQPMSQQKCFATRRRINIQNNLSMMLFHNQYQIGPSQMLKGELHGAMRLEIGTAVSTQLCLGGLVDRMVNQCSRTRRADRPLPGRQARQLLSQYMFRCRATTNVACTDNENSIEQDTTYDSFHFYDHSRTCRPHLLHDFSEKGTCLHFANDL